METGFRSGVPLTRLGISLHWLFLHSATPFKLPMYPFLILNRWPRPTSAEKSSGMNTLKFCAYLPLTSASAASSPVLPSLILLPGGLCLMGHSPHSWTCVLRFIFKIISSVIFLKKKKKKNVLKSLPFLQKSLPSAIQSCSFVERTLQPPPQELLKMWPSDFLTPYPLLFLPPKLEQASRAQSRTCVTLRLSSIDFTTGPSLFSSKLHNLLHYFVCKKKKLYMYVIIWSIFISPNHIAYSGEIEIVSLC